MILSARLTASATIVSSRAAQPSLSIRISTSSVPRRKFSSSCNEIRSDPILRSEGSNSTCHGEANAP